MENGALTYERTRVLSEIIQTLDGRKLERVAVAQIILDGAPEIRDVHCVPLS